MAVITLSVHSPDSLAPLVHHPYEKMSIVLAIGTVPPFIIRLYLSSLSFEVGKQSYDLAHGDGRIIAAGQHHPIEKLQKIA